MGGVVDGKESVTLDFRVDLGGRERGVAQKLLYLAEVGPSGEEMGGERMTQRMWCCVIRKAQRFAETRNGQLNYPR